MNFYDFEVTKYDWMVVIADTASKVVHKIINNPDELRKFYNEHVNDIWVGFNSRHYDQYILKGILLGMNPWKINEHIIVKRKPGWSFSRDFNTVPLINYDVMPNPPIGLKTLEGFMGSDIKESDIDFSIDRPMTKEELDIMLKYCTHDVSETVKVFCHRQNEFHAMMGIVNEFKLPIKHIGDTEARITAKVLECTKHDWDDEFDWFYLPCVQLDKYKYVQDWFEQQKEDIKFQLEWIADDPTKTTEDIEAVKKDFYKRSFTTMVAGVPHTFGFGGLHGAPEEPIHEDGTILHVDVGLVTWLN